MSRRIDPRLAQKQGEPGAPGRLLPASGGLLTFVSRISFKNSEYVVCLGLSLLTIQTDYPFEPSLVAVKICFDIVDEGLPATPMVASCASHALLEFTFTINNS
jgi:hypothetical protein